MTGLRNTAGRMAQKFSVSAPGLGQLVESLRDKGIDWRQTRMAIEKIAEIALGKWQMAARNPKDKGASWFGRQYADGIAIHDRSFTNKSLSVTIGPVGSKALGAAKVVELGRPRFDMKPGLLASKRARKGKNGPYTIIGFRHGIQTIMTAGVQEDFNELKTMTKIGSKVELNAFGGKVARNVYDYSSAGLRKKLGTVTDHGHLSGAVKFQQPVGKDRKAGRSQSQAITFRIVSARSTGWFFPSIQAQKISEEILASIQQEGSDQLKNAVKADLLAYLSGMKQ